MLIQAAVEASKGSSSIFLDAGMIGLIVTNTGLLAREWIRTRREKKNGNGVKPGNGETCKEHGEAIASLNAKQEGSDRAIAEIRGYFITLLERMPPKKG